MATSVIVAPDKRTDGYLALEAVESSGRLLPKRLAGPFDTRTEAHRHVKREARKHRKQVTITDSDRQAVALGVEILEREEKAKKKPPVKKPRTRRSPMGHRRRRLF